VISDDAIPSVAPLSVLALASALAPAFVVVVVIVVCSVVLLWLTIETGEGMRSTIVDRYGWRGAWGKQAVRSQRGTGAKEKGYRFERGKERKIRSRDEW
jgi:hypothetical protein